MIRPGFTTATHSSGFPLPLPIRVSAGFFVTGLSGKIRIQILPPRLRLRVSATRAASICRLVTQPGSSAFSPYSRSEEHTSELQSRSDLVCRLLLEKKKTEPQSSRTAQYDQTAYRCRPPSHRLMHIPYPASEHPQTTPLVSHAARSGARCRSASQPC